MEIIKKIIVGTLGILGAIAFVIILLSPFIIVKHCDDTIFFLLYSPVLLWILYLVGDGMLDKSGGYDDY